ncbi:hypothetical protein ACF0H5_004679 [Mactra antiquata]
MSHPPSVVISRLLNDLGYSYENIVERQRHFAALASMNDSMQITVCGSKREGTTLPLENDVDCMVIFSHVECFDTEEGLRNSTTPIKFMLTGYRNTAPGYALLQLTSLQDSDIVEFIHKCLVEIDGGYFLSSDDLKQQYKEGTRTASFLPGNLGIITTCRDNQGPSSPTTLMNGLISNDNVIAFQCNCRHFIAAWSHRRRPHDWPSRELINEVSSLQAHVVPVGYKGSPVQFLEWRICFTLGEICLIESLNECQIKLIILLKMIAKEELKPICQEMSSYVMKNLVLWLAESFPSLIFQEYNLMKLLNNSLKLLKHCIINRRLPSYMIEERNLFADRITDIEAIQLCEKIDTCLREGPKMLLRCPKIRNGLNMFRKHPVEFNILSEYRQLLLSIILKAGQLMNHRSKELIRKKAMFTAEDVVRLGMESNEDDEIYNDILCPDLAMLIGRGADIMQIVLRRLKYILS